jgi:two-component system, NarL family, sensor kinase
MPHQPVNRREQGITDATEIVDRVIQQVRSISHLLHPPLLDEGGLLSALRWFLEGINDRAGIQTSLELQPTNFPRLAPALERTIFRIVQEGMTNIYRHSQARNARVLLVQRDNALVLTVQDDGIGISDEIAQFRAGSIGVGIGGMRERTREIGGELRLSNLKPGTRIEVLIPAVITNSKEDFAIA